MAEDRMTQLKMIKKIAEETKMPKGMSRKC